MTPPLFINKGGSLLISFSMRSRIEIQRFNCSPIRFKLGLSACRQASLIGSIACKATFNCTTSRGETRPTATFEMIRSKSPIRCNSSSINSLKSGLRKKYSTTFNRSLIGFSSFNGNTIQRFSRRAPIGLIVLSITLRRLLPPSFMLPINSRLRTVNLSRRTYLSSSIRANEVICPT